MVQRKRKSNALKKLKVDNYKPHALIRTQHTQQKYPYLPKPNQKDWIFKLKKISGCPAYSERKVVDKRLGNFVVIFIYLKEKNFGKKTLCRNWLIVQKIAKIFS